MNNLSDYKYPEFNEDFEGMIPQNSGGGGGGMYIMDTKLLVGGETEGDAIVYADFDNLVKAIRNNQPVAFGGEPGQYTLCLSADASNCASPPERGDYVRLSVPQISDDGLNGVVTIQIYKNAPDSGGGGKSGK